MGNQNFEISQNILFEKIILTIFYNVIGLFPKRRSKGIYTLPHYSFSVLIVTSN